MGAVNGPGEGPVLAVAVGASLDPERECIQSTGVQLRGAVGFSLLV